MKEPDGSWDFSKVKAVWGSNTEQAQLRDRMKPVPKAAVGAVRDTLKEQGEAIADGAMTYKQARTANEVLKAQERLKLQQIKGELANRAKALAHVFRFARDERDAWSGRSETTSPSLPRSNRTCGGRRVIDDRFRTREGHRLSGQQHSLHRPDARLCRLSAMAASISVRRMTWHLTMVGAYLRSKT